MSEVDLKSAGGRSRPVTRAALDPWIKNSSLRPAGESHRDRTVSRDDIVKASTESDVRRDSSTVKRGKLERKAAVVCESCGNESCECWRPRSPGCPRTPRLQRAVTSALGAQCTCDPRSPRPSPARLAPRPPVRALSDDEDRPRRLYKSASQKMICSTVDSDNVKKAADPLLETTC